MFVNNYLESLAKPFIDVSHWKNENGEMSFRAVHSSSQDPFLMLSIAQLKAYTGNKFLKFQNNFFFLTSAFQFSDDL